MKIAAIKTRKVVPGDADLLRFLDDHLPRLKNRSVLAITSKVAAILEGSVLPMEGVDKRRLIAEEADEWLPPRPRSKYHSILTIKNGILAVAAGIDESNSAGAYVLWPRDPQRTANLVRKHLMRRFRLRELGVILTDSKTAPLRWGVVGVSIAHSGFRALNDYIGKEDIFGRKLKITKLNVMEALGVGAALVMGEGPECTPLAIIEDVPFVQFQKGNPSPRELAGLRIAPKDDLYGALLRSVRWRKGKGGRKFSPRRG